MAYTQYTSNKHFVGSLNVRFGKHFYRPASPGVLYLTWILDHFKKSDEICGPFAHIYICRYLYAMVVHLDHPECDPQTFLRSHKLVYIFRFIMVGNHCPQRVLEIMALGPDLAHV